MQVSEKKSLIVCLGHDPQLLAIRREVLATCYNARVTSGLDASSILHDGETIDVMLLCHTLSSSECATAKALLHQRSPAAKILRMLPLTGDGSTIGDVPVVLASEGPGRLLQRINNLLLDTA